ncbi:MAG: cysteine desulfurase family protein [bacterium]
MKITYLDHNATTPVRSEVRDAVIPFLGEDFANPSSLHSSGRSVRKAVEKAREYIAELIKSEPDEIVFNSSATEGNNTVLRGFTHPENKNRTHIITTAVEHPCVLNTSKYLRKKGVGVSFLRVDKKGRIDLEELEKLITPETGLISVMMANNETGNIYPVREIGRIAKKHGVLFHTDAVQAAGKISLDVNELKADFLSLSGHKFYGVKGSGALYIRKGLKLDSLLTGGHQEKGRRSGTENVPGIIGMGEAARLAAGEISEDRERIGKLRDYFEGRILDEIPHVTVLGDRKNRLWNTSNMNFSFIEGEAMLLHLDHAGIAVSTGSACSSGNLKPSHVVTAMNIDPEESHSSLRFSMGKKTTEEEIEYTIEKLKKIIPNLRSMSPLYRKK